MNAVQAKSLGRTSSPLLRYGFILSRKSCQLFSQYIFTLPTSPKCKDIMKIFSYSCSLFNIFYNISERFQRMIGIIYHLRIVIYHKTDRPFFAASSYYLYSIGRIHGRHCRKSHCLGRDFVDHLFLRRTSDVKRNTLPVSVFCYRSISLNTPPFAYFIAAPLSPLSVTESFSHRLSISSTVIPKRSVSPTGSFSP